MQKQETENQTVASRPIRFRAWNGKEMKNPSVNMLIDSYNGGAYWQFGYNEPEPMDIVLMQYTGLKDKNGKEIYEGDILRMKAFNPELNIVRFNRGGFCIEPILESPLENSFWPDIKYAEDDGSEVVGNVYENPELLS